MSEQFKQQASLTNEEKMARGSAWMTLGNVGSRLIGVIYILPWYYWMGSHGREANALFNMGYNVYALFLMISTAGIPAAIAKQVAHYNSKQQYELSHRLFKKALIFMGIVGLISAGIMYIASPALARMSGGGAELIPIMRSLSAAILIFPCMSVIRGFFQGNQDMRPYAVSQLAEQVIRVFYMLLATFIIIKVMHGDYLKAVEQSTFAAFIGALASMAALIYFWKKAEVQFEVQKEVSLPGELLDTKALIIDTIRQAIPFTIVGAGTTIYKLVDQMTYVHMMQSFTKFTKDELVAQMAVFGGNPDKLTMVVIGLATSMAFTSLPLVTEAVTQGKHRDLARLINNNFQLYALLMFPATFGMILLAYPLNTFFYEPDKLAAKVLIEACLSGLFVGLFMLTSSTLQGMYYNKAAVKFFAVGIVIKFILQYPCILLFQIYGPLLSTTIGMAVSCYLNIRQLQQATKFNYKLTLRRILLITILTVMMLLAAAIAKVVFGLIFSPEHKMSAFLLCIPVAAVGGAVYLYLILKVGIAERLLGSSITRLRQKLRI
ncbi:polysaccharide biosynthesis protein [Enterococcus cecorum]|uniref:putative polysaccharide biosynthesis protein n=2 Tax=Enterococcus cecorum TaxID=44008 RepID=UPI00148D5E96|nr:polysaccharide biosynthesis protein [Enterococcus cecorum]MDZ5502732.1 polysaccharide biosynthesis protein [Enterococcus cecorum]MDZ5509914.1 polysaccharide biosynthesis protein [Enterococcus cecorum]MDZ5556633.1 polysaccharide biosynthesis protein [Enterococcus cecorum]MDZ5558664.1 polysaccharide biosynthesis protein [Enterococcus cecorum]MDZ5572105.1 polysaccharide biosynthesis protein [Enterococcus cecorum]